MGKLQKIEDTVAGTLPPYNNLKMIVRGRPHFMDPQLDGGGLRFCSQTGAQFTAIMPDNQSIITVDAPKQTNQLIMAVRPSGLGPASLINVGVSEVSGELHIVNSFIGDNGIELNDNLLATYLATPDQERIPVVSLIGTPCTTISINQLATPTPEAILTFNSNKMTVIESWFPIVPRDRLLMSPTPEVLQSLSEYTVTVANFIETFSGEPDSPKFTFETSDIILSSSTVLHSGHGLTDNQMISFTTTGDLPSGVVPNVIYYVRDSTTDTFKVATSANGTPIEFGNVGLGTQTVLIGRTLYRYIVQVETDTGLLPFAPAMSSVSYLKAQPLYNRNGFNEVGGDLTIPNGTGPFLFDAFHGTMLMGYNVKTVLGVRTYDSFGTQINQDYAVGQQWQTFDTGNLLVLERPISSDSLLFWQRVTGNFQYQQNGYFQAELDNNGEFTLSTDLLVPQWPTDKQRGWVIPLFARVDTTVVVQFEPQDPQVFAIAGNTVSYVRPQIYADPTGTPIRRLLFSLKSSPNSRVEIRDWEFDGSAVNSVSYFILGTGDAYGVDRWMAGGFSIKPLFYNLSVLTARYSDGVSMYNAGYMYS